jgi:hypothetical protein
MQIFCLEKHRHDVSSFSFHWQSTYEAGKATCRQESSLATKTRRRKIQD